MHYEIFAPTRHTVSHHLRSLRFVPHMAIMSFPFRYAHHPIHFAPLTRLGPGTRLAEIRQNHLRVSPHSAPFWLGCSQCAAREPRRRCQHCRCHSDCCHRYVRSVRLDPLPICPQSVTYRNAGPKSPSPRSTNSSRTTATLSGASHFTVLPSIHNHQPQRRPPSPPPRQRTRPRRHCHFPSR
jgi:hypothetical protein